jgi:hypothetical protein
VSEVKLGVTLVCEDDGSTTVIFDDFAISLTLLKAVVAAAEAFRGDE